MGRAPLSHVLSVLTTGINKCREREMKNEKNIWSHRVFFPFQYCFILFGSGKLTALFIKHKTVLYRPTACTQVLQECVSEFK